jgi:hypothetical protein
MSTREGLVVLAAAAASLWRLLPAVCESLHKVSLVHAGMQMRRPTPA